MLRLTKRVSPPGLAPTGLRLTGGSLLVLISHMMVAIVFAVGFAWAASLGLGGLAKEPAMSAMDYYYFALLTVTTEGFGVIDRTSVVMGKSVSWRVDPGGRSTIKKKVHTEYKRK